MLDAILTSIAIALWAGLIPRRLVPALRSHNRERQIKEVCGFLSLTVVVVAVVLAYFYHSAAVARANPWLYLIGVVILYIPDVLKRVTKKRGRDTNP